MKHNKYKIKKKIYKTIDVVLTLNAIYIWEFIVFAPITLLILFILWIH